MSPRTPSVMTPLQAGQPRPLPAQQRPAWQAPVSLRLAQPDEAQPDAGPAVRPLDVAQCALCGVTHPLGLMVPDGGAACRDVHWYCKDARSCTERWTTAHAEAARLAAAQAQAEAVPQAGGALGDVHPLSAAS